ncbi:MAG: protein kinase [Plectolyngbya sp. WJT66-NPBG17]|jgi:serine/threonine-protein kinase|nr:protein kinase [Plectolyngbya sp. WJT66-NPBG17]MBW4526091.1 protein kinase [Phormidium tanganyikae FI6-MK23]
MLLANRYQIVRMLGEGGFGQTFLAEDTQMPSKRMCVIKQLKPVNSEPAVYQVIQDRFQREAAILEKFGEKHSQIPKLYAYFSDAGQFYLVQEWIEGETLEQLMTNQTAFDESAVRKILLDLLPVLEFIHSQGMIHRDIKPENIILRKFDRASVLIDYGAVRETMGTVFNSRGNPTSSIVIGTPGYMPAEQAAGRPIPSSDLYSLGLTAIYLLTGKTPQMLESDPQTGEIIWQQFALRLSPEFKTVLAQMVRSHPRDRYSSAAQLQSVLEPGAVAIPPSEASQVGTAIMGSNPSTAVMSSTPNRNRSKLIVAGIVGGGLLTAAIAASLLLNRDNPPAPIVQSPSPSITPTPSPSVQTSPLTVPSPSESPVVRRSPSPIASPTETPQEAPSISIPVALEGIAGGQVRVYSQPSTRSTSPHYGLTGDRVTALREMEGKDGDLWYFVKFSSGAEGWVQQEQTRSANEPPKVAEFPRSAQLVGQASGSRVNLRSAPSTSANSPSYGLIGDQVVALQQAQGDDGKLWYFVQFPSKAAGWVREDLVEFR